MNTKGKDMGKIRYIDEAFVVWCKLDEKSFMKNFSDKVKSSKDFVGIQPKEALTIINKGFNNNFQFGLLYATKEGRNEMCEYLDNIGFGDYLFVADENYKLKLSNTIPVYADYRNDPLFIEWIKNKGKTYNDSIKISDDDYRKIVDTVVPLLQEKKILVSDLVDKDKLPFPKVSIVHFNENGDVETMNYVYQKETDTLYAECIANSGDKMFKTKYYINGAYDSDIKLEYETTLIYKSEKAHDRIMFDTEASLSGDDKEENSYLGGVLWRYFYINYFVRMLPTCYVKTTKSENVTYSEGKGNNKRYKNKVVLKNTYTVSLKHYSTKHIRKVFKCLCWGVRGHYRHLTNGRVIFIQAYRKGKERNNLAVFKEKEYQL